MDNGRPAYVSDLLELREWLDARLDRLRDEHRAALQEVREELQRVTSDHEKRLRELERARWKAAGWAAGVGSVVGLLSGCVGKWLGNGR